MATDKPKLPDNEFLSDLLDYPVHFAFWSVVNDGHTLMLYQNQDKVEYGVSREVLVYKMKMWLNQHMVHFQENLYRDMTWRVTLIQRDVEYPDKYFEAQSEYEAVLKSCEYYQRKRMQGG